MTGSFSYAPESGMKKSGRKINRILIFVGIILAAELTWLFIISPCLPFSTIDVYGFPGIERSEVLSLAGIWERSSFFSTNIHEIQNKIASHSLVESVKVIKRFPDRISIYLDPRKAIVVSLVSVDNEQIPVYIDRHGVIMKIGNGAQDNNLLVLSGLEFEAVHVNMRLPSELIPFLENVSRLLLDFPELMASISEIRVEKKAWEGIELVLFPMHSSIRVRVENNLSDETLRYVLLILDVFNKQNPKPEEIDFRSGIGSFKIKEPGLW
jgi:cell division protein FtsQ